MISGIENLRAMFGVFHDGDLRFHGEQDGALDFEIGILYLAERVNPAYKSFSLRLSKPRRFVFKPWWPEGHALHGTSIEGDSLFSHELEILYARLEGNGMSISCNANTDADFRGGDLYLEAESAVVLDEGSKEYSLDELISLCQGYWRDWKSKHSQRRANATGADNSNE